MKNDLRIPRVTRVHSGACVVIQRKELPYSSHSVTSGIVINNQHY